MKNIKTKQVSLSNWREEVQLEAKVDDVKYGKGNSEKKSKNNKADIHSLSWNKGVKTDRNNRRNRTDVVFHGHSKVERDRQQAHYKKRGVKKVKGVKEEVIDEKVATGPRLGEPREKGATHVNAGEGEKIQKRTKKWMKKRGLPGAPGLDAMKAREDEHRKKRGVKKEHVEGGINVQNVADGLNFTEIETVDIIKTKPIKGASNWKLEMVTEMLISEGYNDDEIATILTEGVDDVGGPLSIGGVLSGIMKAGKFTYNLGKNTRGIVNRGIRDTKLTKDIFSTAKKLRNPDGVSITKSPKANVPSKGGGLVKSFKGFIQNIKDAGSNLVNRTKGKLDRINAKKAEIQTTAKDVDVLGGAATTPKPTSTPMKNITPTPIGDGIAKVANQVKTGATAAVAGSGVVAGSKLTSNSPSKVAIGTEKPLSASIRGDQKKNAPTEIKKDEAPIINDGKKEINPSKNEKIESQPTKRELRNKRNNALSSPEGKRARRDAALEKAKLRGRPRLQGLEKMKTGTPINQLFKKEEVTNEGIKYLKGGNEKNLALPKGRKIRHGVDGIDYTMLVKNNEKQNTVAASHELEGEMTEGAIETITNWLKLTKDPKNHEVSDKTMTGKAITGLQKRDKANQEAMKLLNQSYSWRKDLGILDEGGK